MRFLIKPDPGHDPAGKNGSVTAYQSGRPVATVGYDWTRTANAVKLTSDLPFRVQTRIADLGAMIVGSQAQPHRLWANAVAEISVDIDIR